MVAEHVGVNISVERAVGVSLTEAPIEGVVVGVAETDIDRLGVGELVIVFVGDCEGVVESVIVLDDD